MDYEIKVVKPEKDQRKPRDRSWKRLLDSTTKQGEWYEQQKIKVKDSKYYLKQLNIWNGSLRLFQIKNH